jgi:uncharacterized membrane protein YciS (DUF1049 family)
MVAIEAGDETASTTMFGSVAIRERRSLWAILSFLFLLGFVVSTLIVHAERNRALDSVAQFARDDAQLLTATLTGKQLTQPVRGASYDKLSARVGKSVGSKGSIIGVTVWSSDGQILFSLNESLVGTTPPEMLPLIIGISQGSGGTRVLDDTVQTFMPVSKAIGGPVAVVELDQPLAFVEARIGAFWNMLRMVFAFGLVVSLLLLGFAFVSSRNLARAPEDDERQEGDERPEGDEGAEMKAEEQPEEPPTWEPAPTVEEDPQALQPDLDQALDQDLDQDTAGDLEKELEAEIESQELMRQRRDEFKARAKEAELRVKKLEEELHTAPSAPKSEQ